MPDTIRTRNQLQTALADNTTQAITAQVLRDFLASIALAAEAASLYDAAGAAAAVAAVKADKMTSPLMGHFLVSDVSGNPVEDEYTYLSFDAAGAAAAVQTNLNTHTADTNNPHGTTLAQVLSAGNDADSQNLTNVGSVAATSVYSSGLISSSSSGQFGYAVPAQFGTWAGQGSTVCYSHAFFESSGTCGYIVRYDGSLWNLVAGADWLVLDDSTATNILHANKTIGLRCNSGPIRPKVYTVATLPAAGDAGRIAFVSNGRKNGEGAAAGTGVLVFDDGTAWIASDSGTTVAA